MNPTYFALALCTLHVVSGVFNSGNNNMAKNIEIQAKNSMACFGLRAPDRNF